MGLGPDPQLLASEATGGTSDLKRVQLTIPREFEYKCCKVVADGFDFTCLPDYVRKDGKPHFVKDLAERVERVRTVCAITEQKPTVRHRSAPCRLRHQTEICERGLARAS